MQEGKETTWIHGEQCLFLNPPPASNSSALLPQLVFTCLFCIIQIIQFSTQVSPPHRGLPQAMKLKQSSWQPHSPTHNLPSYPTCQLPIISQDLEWSLHMFTCLLLMSPTSYLEYKDSLRQELHVSILTRTVPHVMAITCTWKIAIITKAASSQRCTCFPKTSITFPIWVKRTLRLLSHNT